MQISPACVIELFNSAGVWISRSSLQANFNTVSWALKLIQIFTSPEKSMPVFETSTEPVDGIRLLAHRTSTYIPLAICRHSNDHLDIIDELVLYKHEYVTWKINSMQFLKAMSHIQYILSRTWYSYTRVWKWCVWSFLSKVAFLFFLNLYNSITLNNNVFGSRYKYIFSVKLFRTK